MGPFVAERLLVAGYEHCSPLVLHLAHGSVPVHRDFIEAQVEHALAPRRDRESLDVP